MGRTGPNWASTSTADGTRQTILTWNCWEGVKTCCFAHVMETYVAGVRIGHPPPQEPTERQSRRCFLSIQAGQVLDLCDFGLAPQPSPSEAAQVVSTPAMATGHRTLFRDERNIQARRPNPYEHHWLFIFVIVGWSWRPSLLGWPLKKYVCL